MNRFREISIAGDARSRGIQHGEQLRSEIESTLAFYREIFQLGDADILSHAAYFRDVIANFSCDYLEEIDGIARGANIDLPWIVALNARTEILSRSRNIVANECTSVYFSNTSILGQNWDWGRALEPLTVVMKIERPESPAICMITEPGIIGKIGMNSAGIGVCLNILTTGKPLDGLPIHVLLRAILDCRSIDEVERLLAAQAKGKASNIIVADNNGYGFNMEFCDQQQFRLEPQGGVLFHTNHYLGGDINSPDNPDFFSSYARYGRASQLLSENPIRSVESMCELLVR